MASTTVQWWRWWSYGKPGDDYLCTYGSSLAMVYSEDIYWQTGAVGNSWFGVRVANPVLFHNDPPHGWCKSNMPVMAHPPRLALGLSHEVQLWCLSGNGVYGTSPSTEQRAAHGFGEYVPLRRQWGKY